MVAALAAADAGSEVLLIAKEAPAQIQYAVRTGWRGHGACRHRT